MPSTKSSLGDKTNQTVDKAGSHMTQDTHATDPRPEDLPFDASPGTDEEFGVHAATMHVEPRPRSHSQPEKGASDRFGDSVEGVLLRLVNAS